MTIPQQFTIPANPTFEARIENIPWADGTLFNWGLLELDTAYLAELNVTNTSPYTCKILLLYEDLPSTVTFTWTLNNTDIASNAQAIADMTLTTPTNMASGTYTFNTYIKLEGP